MDQTLALKISRQLRVLNAIMVFFTVIFIGTIIVAVVFVYAAVKEVRKAEAKLQNAQNSVQNLQDKASGALNVQNDLCSAKGTLGTLLKNQSDVCN